MSATPDQAVPLCVDLDGTLLRTDTLLECLVLLMKEQPLSLLFVPFWVFRGKSYLKAMCAQRVNFVGKSFPYNSDVVSFIESQDPSREIVLITGANQSLANSISEDCGLFDKVAGSSEQLNLTGNNKLQWLVEQYGENGFDYIGNDKDDLKIWPHARKAMAVSTPNGIQKSAERLGISLRQVFSEKKTGLMSYAKLLRVHQWAKNSLIFVPYLLDRQIGDPTALFQLFTAFFAMCFLASCTYILNDMLDIQADRTHISKSARMMASGDVSILAGFIAFFTTGLLFLFCCYFLNTQTVLALFVYLAITLAYSFRLKQIILIDVSILAALHTIRVVIGTVAISAVWSFWLLAFSMFVFFSLATAKRVAELINLEKTGTSEATGRGYLTTDLPVLLTTGVSTAYISILVVALYIDSEKVSQMYAHPEILWFVCPALMYWVGRIWIKAWRGLLSEDPILFALKDRVSLFTLLSVVAIVALAKFPVWGAAVV